MAFFECSGLKSIIIPDNVNCIYDNTFEGCTGLTSVTFPASLTCIKREAFKGCTGLTTLDIPNNIVGIESSAFIDCSALTSIKIGSEIRYIDPKAFANCAELADVYCYAEKVPETSSDCFEGSYPAYIILHVPANSVDTYKATEPWSGFKSVLAIEDTGIAGARNNSILIRAEKGVICVDGAENGTAVSIYSTNGAEVGTSVVKNNKVLIPSNLPAGSIAIVNVNNKSVKVIIK